MSLCSGGSANEYLGWNLTAIAVHGTGDRISGDTAANAARAAPTRWSSEASRVHRVPEQRSPAMRVGVGAAGQALGGGGLLARKNVQAIFCRRRHQPRRPFQAVDRIGTTDGSFGKIAILERRVLCHGSASTSPW